MSTFILCWDGLLLLLAGAMAVATMMDADVERRDANPQTPPPPPPSRRDVDDAAVAEEDTGSAVVAD